MSHNGFLLRLAVKCPSCGARPSNEIFPTTRDKYIEHWDDDEPVETVRCQRKNCGKFYVITAKAYKGAA